MTWSICVSSLVFFLLTIVVLAPDVVGETTPTMRHACVHHRFAIPLEELPMIPVVKQSAHQSALVSALSEMRNASSATDHLPLTDRAKPVVASLAERLSSHGLRPLVVKTELLLASACTSVGQEVDTYDGSGRRVTCSAEDVLTEKKASYIADVLRHAVAKLSKMLFTEPTASFNVPGNACPGVPTAGGEVHDIDFVLFVSAMPQSTGTTEQSPAAPTGIAWGRSCVRSSDVQGPRPIIGQVNFLPSGIRTGSAQMRESDVAAVDVRVAMHEISHGLGFSSLASTLSSFIDERGVRQLRPGTATVYRAGLGKHVTVVQTPRVLAAARRHFSCPTLDGVEIEDNGGSGTAGSHWKQRILLQEALVGTVSTTALFYSSLTLAFFEDAGFYAANYDLAEDGSLLFGKDAGCDFVMESCRTYALSHSSLDYCFREADGEEKPISGDAKSLRKALKQQRCTRDRRGIGYCDVVAFDMELAPQYRYFARHPNVGSSAATLDHCPVVTAFNNLNCVQGPTSGAGDSDFQLPSLANVYGNEFGPDSRCFTSNLLTSALPLSARGVRCLPHVCSSTGQLLLRVQGQAVACPLDGSAGRADTSNLTGVHGYIDCPPAAELCASRVTSAHEDEKVHSATTAQTPTSERLSIDQSGVLSTTAVQPCSRQRQRCETKMGFLTALPLCARTTQFLDDCLGNSCRPDAAALLLAVDPSLSRRCARDRESVARGCLDGWDGARMLCRTLDISSF